MRRFIPMLLAIVMLLSLAPQVSLTTFAKQPGDIEESARLAESPDQIDGFREGTVGAQNNMQDIAIPIQEGEKIDVNITSPEELVYFSFTPQYTEEYCFRSSYGSDPYGYLYDADGNQLAYHEDIPFDWNFSISYYLTAGETYYGAVGDHTPNGPHSVGVTFFALHTFETEELRPATCFQTGEVFWFCECGYSYTEITPIVHEYQDGACVLCGVDECYTGQCGELTWTVYGKTGSLVISGIGPIPDYDPFEGFGWYVHRDSIRTITIESGVTYIGEGAFNGMNNVENVFIGDTVTAIGNAAFRYNYGLTSIVIPDSVTTIGEEAFCYCTGLKKVTFGNGVSNIAKRAFVQCHNLTEVTIPKSVMTIGEEPFSGCESLTAIWVEEENPYFSADEYGVLFNKDKTILIRCPEGIGGEYIIPDGVITIGDYAFYSCKNLYRITIPEGVTSIGNYGFSFCSYLRHADIPDSVISIGDYGFHCSGSIYYVNLSGSVTTIGQSAFGSCSGLTDVTIGDSVTYMGNSAFSYCYNLRTVTFGNGVTAIGDSTFINCTSLKQVNISNSITSVGKDAFYGCRGLTTVTIPGSVSFIGENAFGDCKTLTEIRVAKDSKYYTDNDQGILFDKEKTTLVRYPQGLAGSYSIPDSVTTIANYAFNRCYELTDITIGKSVTTIGDDAFHFCDGLTALTIPSNVKSIGCFTFASCYSLKTVTIEGGATTIGQHAFSICSALSGVLWGDNTTSIYEFAFGNCNNLVHMHFEEKIPEKSNLAFYESNPQLKLLGKDEATDWDEVAVILAPNCAEPGSGSQSCLVCGVKRTVVLPPTGEHSYESGICTGCGKGETAPTEPIEDPSLKIYHSLNLASDISVNFVVEKTLLTGYDMDTVYMEAAVDLYEGNEKTGTKVTRMYPIENEKYYYFILSDLTAVNINDRISSILYGTKDGQAYYSPVDEYSIATYAYSQMSRSTNPEPLKVLCADLLRYGTKTQIYKNYRLDNLADANMTEEHKAYLSDMETVSFSNTNTVLNDVENAPIQWMGKALNLESKVCLKFIFSLGSFAGDVSDLTLRVRYNDINGGEKNLTLSNGELYNAEYNFYTFSLDTLLASELRSVVSVQVYNGEIPVSNTLQYSADTYGNDKTGALGILCKALFAYSDSAKAYFS